MSGRIRETAEGESFICECDCTGEWKPLLEVEEAAEEFSSWNYCHGLGGLSLECTDCCVTYVLGGRVDRFGLPDLIEARELYQIPRVELTRLQRRCLDISLTAEETLWNKGMDLVRAANHAGDIAASEGLWEAAKLLRGALQREKRETLRAILLEHGIDDVPENLRIARTSDGKGCVYEVNRGRLPFRKKVATAPEVRIPDVEAYVESPEREEIYQRVLDLSD